MTGMTSRELSFSCFSRRRTILREATLRIRIYSAISAVRTFRSVTFRSSMVKSRERVGGYSRIAIRSEEEYSTVQD